MSTTHKDPAKNPNKLLKASSPYLQQHAYNPVEWNEWGEEAFKTARAEDKLVVVSIGYSACHWCHVMERESFEDKDTADIMNAFFVNIKVDREERPDIDQIYMDAVQLMSGRGGWPLNVICLPDGRPIQGGTYFPNEQWNRLLLHVSNFYRSNREKAESYASRLEEGIKGMSGLLEVPPHKDEIKKEHFMEMVMGAEASFDRMEGGFDRAPKFPMPAVWEWLLYMDELFPGSEARKHTWFTLRKMALGGMYDPIGGGFARYSVDERWFIPHFEKMLYDNAQLLSLYSNAYRKNPDPLIKDVMEQTSCWLLEEMRHPSGGFFSALDADSEGVEGKYYVWTYNELMSLLPDDMDWLQNLYGISQEGNWEHGNNVLYAKIDKYEYAKQHQPPNFLSRHDQAFAKMFAVRSERIRPGLDDKILASWNGLLLSGFASCVKASGNFSVRKAMFELVDFIKKELFVEDRLYRVWKDGKATVPAFLEDYAAVILGFIDVYELSGDEAHVVLAKKLCDQAIELFYHKDQSMFSFKAKDEEVLIAHRFETQDNVIPSSNAQMASALLQLHYVFDESDYLQITDNMLARIRPQMLKFPNWHARWAKVLYQRFKEPRVICCTGPDASVVASTLQGKYFSFSDRVFFNETQNSMLPVFHGRLGSETKIYVCEGHQCYAPVSSVDEAISQYLLKS